MPADPGKKIASFLKKSGCEIEHHFVFQNCLQILESNELHKFIPQVFWVAFPKTSSKKFLKFSDSKVDPQF